MLTGYPTPKERRKNKKTDPGPCTFITITFLFDTSCNNGSKVTLFLTLRLYNLLNGFTTPDLTQWVSKCSISELGVTVA